MRSTKCEDSSSNFARVSVKLRVKHITDGGIRFEDAVTNEELTVRMNVKREGPFEKKFVSVRVQFVFDGDSSIFGFGECLRR